jgi:hypothetical protein
MRKAHSHGRKDGNEAQHRPGGTAGRDGIKGAAEQWLEFARHAHHVNEQVDVAVGSVLPARHRAEKANPANVLASHDRHHRLAPGLDQHALRPANSHGVVMVPAAFRITTEPADRTGSRSRGRRTPPGRHRASRTRSGTGVTPGSAANCYGGHCRPIQAATPRKPIGAMHEWLICVPIHRGDSARTGARNRQVVRCLPLFLTKVIAFGLSSRLGRFPARPCCLPASRTRMPRRRPGRSPRKA